MLTLYGTISNKKDKRDKNGNAYLILKLEDKSSLFVFADKINPND